jgi:hypothetical protein
MNRSNACVFGVQSYKYEGGNDSGLPTSDSTIDTTTNSISTTATAATSSLTLAVWVLSRKLR